jgi:hypothetical protein
MSILQKSSNILPDIITLVSSVNIAGSDGGYFVEGRSFMSAKALVMILGKLQVLLFQSLRKISVLVDDFISTFYFLSAR